MKVLWLTIALLTSCASTTKEYLKIVERQNGVAALFVADPFPKWTSRGSTNKKHSVCSAVFAAPHFAVTSIACFPSEKDGVHVYDLNTIVLENEDRRFTVEKVFFAEAANIVLLRTKEEGYPVHFDRRDVSYGEQLRLIGFSISGFRRFSQMEGRAAVSATRFGNEQDGEFFIVRMEINAEPFTGGTALTRQSGELAGIIARSGRGRALIIPADIIYWEVRRVEP